MKYIGNTQNITNLFKKKRFDPSGICKGFTLVEILIVIAIIGILIASLISVLNPIAQVRKGADAERKSDLRQYTIALENYSNNNSSAYPIHVIAVGATSLCSGSGSLDSYMSGCPADKNPNQSYQYISDASGSTWNLWAQMESQGVGYWVICSNGKAGAQTNAPSSSVCPLP